MKERAPTYLDRFMSQVLVRCPACGEAAVFARPAPYGSGRMTCASCGAVRSASTLRLVPEPGRRELAADEFVPWLATPCCGETLWAANLAHVAALEEIVGARLRERTRDEVHGWSNQAMSSRLPGWVLAAKHRDEVLVGLEQLRAMAP